MSATTERILAGRGLDAVCLSPPLSLGSPFSSLARPRHHYLFRILADFFLWLLGKFYFVFDFVCINTEIRLGRGGEI